METGRKFYLYCTEGGTSLKSVLFPLKEKTVIGRDSSIDGVDIGISPHDLHLNRKQIEIIFENSEYRLYYIGMGTECFINGDRINEGSPYQVLEINDEIVIFGENVTRGTVFRFLTEYEIEREQLPVSTFDPNVNKPLDFIPEPSTEDNLRSSVIDSEFYNISEVQRYNRDESSRSLPVNVQTATIIMQKVGEPKYEFLLSLENIFIGGGYDCQLYLDMENIPDVIARIYQSIDGVFFEPVTDNIPPVSIDGVRVSGRKPVPIHRTSSIIVGPYKISFNLTVSEGGLGADTDRIAKSAEKRIADALEIIAQECAPLSQEERDKVIVSAVKSGVKPESFVVLREMISHLVSKSKQGDTAQRENPITQEMLSIFARMYVGMINSYNHFQQEFFDRDDRITQVGATLIHGGDKNNVLAEIQKADFSQVQTVKLITEELEKHQVALIDAFRRSLSSGARSLIEEFSPKNFKGVVGMIKAEDLRKKYDHLYDQDNEVLENKYFRKKFMRRYNENIDKLDR